MIKSWKESKSALEETLVTGEIHRNISMEIYKLIVKDKTNNVPQFEELEIQAKLKIWDRAKALANGRLDKETCVQLAKSIYILDIISEP
jgi:hypothetical protein